MEISLEELHEDTPFFHSKLQAEMKKIKLLQKNLKNIIKCAANYKKAVDHLSDVGYKFVDLVHTLTPLIFEDRHNPEEQQLGIAFSSLGVAFKSVTDGQKKSIQQFYNLIITPLEKFLRFEIKKASKIYSNYDRAKSNRTSAVNRYLVSQKKNSEKLQELVLKSDIEYYEQASRLVSSLDLVIEKKKYDLFNGIFGAMISQSDFYHHAFQSTKSIETSMGKCNNILHNILEKYSKIEKEEYYRVQDIKDFVTKLHQKKKTNKEKLEHSGWLLVKTTGMSKSLKTRFYKISNNKLYYIDQKTLNIMEPMDLLFCTVKNHSLTGKRNCFEVVSSNTEKSVILNAPYHESMETWIKVLNNNIEKMIKLQTTKTKSENSTISGKELIDRIYKIPGNNVCADCKSPNPEWISINLGITICIHCSGAHRAISSDYSKTRSLILDDFDETLLPLFEFLGNNKVNTILERLLDPEDKPDSNSWNQEKRSFVMKKYVVRSFATPLSTKENFSELLYESLEKNDFENIFLSLLAGADPNWKNPSNDCISCLHLAAQLNVEPYLYVLLIRFGADINQLDNNFFTPIHYAVHNDNANAVQLLLKLKAKVDLGSSIQQEKNYLSPLELAIQLNYQDCIKLLQQNTNTNTYVSSKNTNNIQNNIKNNTSGINRPLPKIQSKNLKKQLILRSRNKPKLSKGNLIPNKTNNNVNVNDNRSNNIDNNNNNNNNSKIHSKSMDSTIKRRPPPNIPILKNNEKNKNSKKMDSVDDLPPPLPPRTKK
ncbi:centaurin/arf [Anaeramoeba flamelloides]|uniref:Centaurin/arf n=1 Tax=Anaeramoeba flamelloides TaxID=1746091 RepID=A0ABQ8Z4L4_9EUKA|nr:centaurin/arf [Anaeramoeba flamelloides]